MKHPIAFFLTLLAVAPAQAAFIPLSGTATVTASGSGVVPGPSSSGSPADSSQSFYDTKTTVDPTAGVSQSASGTLTAPIPYRGNASASQNLVLTNTGFDYQTYVGAEIGNYFPYQSLPFDALATSLLNFTFRLDEAAIVDFTAFWEGAYLGGPVRIPAFDRITFYLATLDGNIVCDLSNFTWDGYPANVPGWTQGTPAIYNTILGAGDYRLVYDVYADPFNEIFGSVESGDYRLNMTFSGVPDEGAVGLALAGLLGAMVLLRRKLA